MYPAMNIRYPAKVRRGIMAVSYTHLLYGVNDLVRNAENRAVAEAGGDGGSAVNASELRILGKAAQLQRLLNDWGKVLVLADMYDFRIGDHLGGEDPVFIAVLGRHQAVGGEEDRRGEICKFLLLILPRRAEVALEVRIFLQLRVTVGRQHLAVGVDVDALVLSLLQEPLQIVQIVAGDYEMCIRDSPRAGAGRCGQLRRQQRLWQQLGLEQQR